MSKRRSRKRRASRAAPSGAAPRAASSTRRERTAAAPRTATRAPGRTAATRRAPGQAATASASRRGYNPLGPYGERPPGPFAGLPVSEVAIFAGIVGVIVGLLQGGWALIVGAVVCTLGVIEVTAREHFTGYRSHSTLLSAVPAVGVEIAIVALLGEPRERPLLLLAVVPVYAVAFWALRKRFQVARQARMARPPAP